MSIRIVVHRFGGPDQLTVVDQAVPTPGRGEARVKVSAAGVAFPDLLMREGTYPGGPKPPFTPGYDLVGTIDALGEGVADWRLGQRVAALTVFGSYASFVCLPADRLVPVLEGVDPAEAVSLVLNYVTAYQMLHRAAGVRGGERLLVHGAAGGVGTAVLQLGALAGLEMFGTARAEQFPTLEQLGATPIDYRGEDFVGRIRELTGDGVDVVLDGIGGRVSLGSYRALRRGGRLIMFGHHGTLQGGRKSVPRVLMFYAVGALVFLANVLPDGRAVRAYQIAKLRDRHPDWFRADLTTLLAHLQRDEIRPLVADRLHLAEARRAHEALARGGITGKLVLLGDTPGRAEMLPG